MAKTDPLFAAKAALFTRHQNGLRSVAHIVAGELARSVKGKTWTRRFFDKAIFRVDDITETLAYYSSKYGRKSIPNSLRDGLGRALTRFDEYHLAKYQGKGKEVNLYDAVNICHPKATDALTALMKGTLKPAETWETGLTAAGKAEDVDQAKAQVWGDLIKSGKLGYLAALRNLRNIAKQAPECMPDVLAFISNPANVAKSKVVPFQFQTAMDAIEGSEACTNQVKRALNAAMEASLSNVPKFQGKTLIALDCSVSMNGLPFKNGSLFSSVLFKAQEDADFILFSEKAFYLRTLNPDDSLSTTIQTLYRNANQGGTNFNAIFMEAGTTKYDRIIILSDMQSWMQGACSTGIYCQQPVSTIDSFKQYKRASGCNPFLYSFNLNAVDGTLQFPESKVFCLAGFSNAILGLMQQLEKDPEALIHEIEAIEI